MNDELPDDISKIAKALRATFGPGVKLLRVVGDGVDLGNAKWDAVMALVEDKPCAP